MKTLKLLVLSALLAVVAMLPVNQALSASQDKKAPIIVLSKSNTLVLNDAVSGESALQLMQAAKELDRDSSYKAKFGFPNKEPIYLFMYTPGGSIQSGLELLEGLHGLNRPISTITSFSASMGFQIVQGLGERLILQSGVLMSHPASGGAEGNFTSGPNSQLRNRLGLWERRMQEMDELTVKRTNGKQTMESYTKAYAPELWVTGSQSVEQGYADRMVTVSCDKTLDGFTTHTIMFMGVIPISYDLAKCPLNSTPTNIRVAVETNKGRMDMGEFMEKGGGFGVSCIQLAVLDSSKVCAADTSLTFEKLSQTPRSFLDRYINIRNHVIPLSVQ